MGFEPLEWYCKPVPNGVWTKMVDYAFGAYTPCAIDSFVLGISHLVLLILCLYRLWLTLKDHKVHKFCLRSKWYTYLLALLAAYSTAEPLFRLVMRVSILDLDGAGFPPYEAFMLALEAFAWGSALVMTVVETKTYIHELRWFVRFAVIYALVGDMVLLNLVLSVKEYYGSFHQTTNRSNRFCSYWVNRFGGHRSRFNRSMVSVELFRRRIIGLNINFLNFTASFIRFKENEGFN